MPPSSTHSGGAGGADTQYHQHQQPAHPPVVAADAAVDVPLLMSHPKAALLGVLQLLEGWGTAVLEDDISVEQFSGAMTNMVYRCGLLQGGREVQVVLMRVHASASDLFDRQTEIDTFKGVSSAGLGPRLLLLFSNGRVEEFLGEHVTLAASDIHDPAVSAAIATTLAAFHTRISLVMSQEGQPQAVQLWDRLRLWLGLVQQVASATELQQLGMADLQHEIDALEQQLTAQHPCWVALCHNDLQYGNIMARVGSSSTADEISSQAADSAAVAAAAVAGSSSNVTSSSLTQQLQALGLDSAASPGISPRQQLLQPSRAAAAGAAAAGAGHSSSVPPGFRQAAGPESLASDDAASLSNVSVAGSTAPSISGLSAYSAATSTAAAAAATSLPAAGPAGLASSSNLEASLADSVSTSSLQVLGRSPHSTVQLPDGSLVLRGMRARPRGQSPDPARGKRPETSGTSFSSSRQGSEQWGSAAAAADTAAAASRSAAGTSAGHSSSSRLGAVPQELQPPSAAAVLRHASSTDGDLLLQLMPDDPEAVADAGLARRRRISHADSASAANRSSGSGSSSSSSSSSDEDGSSDTTSAADSAAAEDLLLVPQHLRPPAAAAGLAAERAAAVSRSARKYRAVRKARRMPAEGLEFPTLVTSDAEGGDGSSSDASSSSLSDSELRRGASSSDAAPGVQQDSSRGRSPCSRYHAPAAAAGAGAGASAAVFASPVAAAVTRASADGDADAASSCITFIDYEYSGFNPVAFDIANHWCEWAADYHTGAPHVLDFSRLPSQQEQQLFVEAYLRALLGKLGVQVPLATAGAAAAGARTASAAASPEPPSAVSGLLDSSLAGYKLQQQGSSADGSRRSEPAWSTLSSRGGSVLSFPETDASGWETASQSSVVTTRSNKTEGEGDGLSAAAAPAGGQADALPLCDVWRWLERVADLSRSSRSGSSSAGGGRQLSAAAWQELVRSVVAASRAYMAASHLQWALWGVIQAKVSDVDFDFTGYGQQRWEMYLQTRPAAASGASPLLLSKQQQ